jgi:hypothetical protein
MEGKQGWMAAKTVEQLPQPMACYRSGQSAESRSAENFAAVFSGRLTVPYAFAYACAPKCLASTCNLAQLYA